MQPQRRAKRTKPRTTTPKRMWWRQLVVGVILVGIAAVIIYGTWKVTRLERFTLVSIEVIGGETIDHALITEEAERLLTGTYLKLVPRRFAYGYPRQAIEDRVAAIPRVKQVAVDRIDTRTLGIVFEEYQPFALWCHDQITTECLYLDRFGYAFAVAPQLQGGAFLRYVNQIEPVVGTEAFTAEFVRATNAFVITLYDQLGLNIVAVAVERNDVTYQVAGGGEIRTTTNATYTDTLANLETILTSNEFGHLGPGAFTYIDLRYGNKVFVHEGETKTATSTDEATE